MLWRMVQEKVALRAVIRGRKHQRHDFRRNGSCSVPLTLGLRNCSDSAVSVCVEAGPPSGFQPAGTVRRTGAVVTSKSSSAPFQSPVKMNSGSWHTRK